ncbi:ABC transporter permease [Cellulomonas sp. KRMCY2]|uniref:ABC transporter permease n=1 Tax=Cellulomonas sp. KRMCY2 TaxID=1304865 RepID=UPI00045EB4D2|nr:ABC transporter permease [Cellulomonas sp. KRMCY2]
MTTTTLDAPAWAPSTTLRSGPGYWLTGYRTMLRWHLSSLRMWLFLLVMIQALIGVGYVLGFALFFSEIPRTAALWVSTGTPVLNLVLLGMLLGPQLVAGVKQQGGYDFVQALPVPRTASAAAWYTVTLIGGIPGMIITLLAAQVRYDPGFTVSPAVVPATLLIVFTGTMIGYALAHAIANPMTTQLITQALVFLAMGFAPILFPAEQMPAWLAELNEWLPLGHMATIMRDVLTDGLVTDVGRSYLVVSVWGAVCCWLAVRALGRRR